MNRTISIFKFRLCQFIIIMVNCLKLVSNHNNVYFRNQINNIIYELFYSFIIPIICTFNVYNSSGDNNPIAKFKS